MDRILKRDSLEYTKEKERFLKDLYQFHCNRGTPYHKLPHVQGNAADLYLLYSLVSTSGGYNKVNEGDKWDDFAEQFSIPKGCANGAQALKFIYHRYLYLYERMHLFGDDPDQADEGDEYDEPGTGSSSGGAAALLQRKHDRAFCSAGVPLIYNYRQHHVDYGQRQYAGMSTMFARPNQYARLEKSLLCGLPNEVDFAFNVCTMLSAEGNHTLRLLTHPRLLDLLLAHVGIVGEDSSLKPLYEGPWTAALDRDFTKFWRQSTEDADLLGWLHLPGASNQDDGDHSAPVDVRDDCYATSFNLGAGSNLKQAEGLRVQQVAAILRNLSFDGCNARALAASANAFRFVLLCSSSKFPSLRHDGLEMFSNIAARLVLKPLPDESTQLVFRAVHKCLSSGDKFQIVNGLEIISNLARVEANEDTLSENLDLMTYDSVASSMKIKDIQLIASALDALYQLSELGDRTCDKIARTEHCIDMLVSLVTVEAHSFGDEAVMGIRVVDETPYHRLPERHMLQPAPLAATPPYRPPLGMAPPGAMAGFQPGPRGPSQQQPPHLAMASGPPMDKQHPVAIAAASPPANLSPETIACNWLRVNFEPSPESTVSTSSMLSDFMLWLQKKSLPGLQGAQQFISCVKFVFPSSDCVRRAAGPSGAADLLHVGLRRREASSAVPSLQPAPSTGMAPPPSRPATPQAPGLPMHHSPAMAGLLCNGGLLPQQHPTAQQQQHYQTVAPSGQAQSGWNGMAAISPRGAPLPPEVLPPYMPGGVRLPPPPPFPNAADATARSSPTPAAGSASSALKNLLQSRLIQNHELGMSSGAAVSRTNASSHASANGGGSGGGNGTATSIYGSPVVPLVGDWIPPAPQQQQLRPCFGSGLAAPSPAGFDRMPMPPAAIGVAAAVPPAVSPQPSAGGPHSPRRILATRASRASARLAGSPAAGSPSAMPPRMLELQICGEAEKAGDINIAAAEAKIERVENLGARDDNAACAAAAAAATAVVTAPAQASEGRAAGDAILATAATAGHQTTDCSSVPVRTGPDPLCNGRAAPPLPPTPPPSEPAAQQLNSLPDADKPCKNGGCSSDTLPPPPVMNGHASDRTESASSPDSVESAVGEGQCFGSSRCDGSGEPAAIGRGGGRKWLAHDDSPLPHVNGLVNGVGSSCPEAMADESVDGCKKRIRSSVRVNSTGNGTADEGDSSSSREAAADGTNGDCGPAGEPSDIDGEAALPVDRGSASAVQDGGADAAAPSAVAARSGASNGGDQNSGPCSMEVSSAADTPVADPLPQPDSASMSPPPEKRQRTASVESEQSTSSASTLSSTTATTAASSSARQTPLGCQTLQHGAAPPPPIAAPAGATSSFLCEWASCGCLLPEDAARMRLHVLDEHLRRTAADGSCCLWEACDGLRRQRWSLVSHVLDKHCTETALRAALARRQQEALTRSVAASGSPVTGSPSSQQLPSAAIAPPLPPVYGVDAARQAIMRNIDRPPYPDIMDAREGPVTKHFRYTSALILRNVARYSAFGLSMIKKHEGTLSYVALSSMESSAVASGCLWEMHRQQLPPQQQQHQQ